MRNIFISVFIATSGLMYSQSFVFCPQIETEEKIGFEDVKVSIIFNDSRTYEEKLKEKCKKDEIFDEFTQCLKRTYPKMKLISLDENLYHSDPVKANVTMLIKILKFDATFKTGNYHANTKFEAKIFLYSDDEKIFEQTFEGKDSKVNFLGYGSCKSALNNSFKSAFDSFSLYLSEVSKSTVNLVNIDPAKNIKIENNKSKAERLRELKQLLDEKILTTEEYEIEKKKILDEENK